MIPKIGGYELGDAISCTVTEERNGKYEFKMVYSADGRNADKIVAYAEISAKPNEDDKEQLFRVYRITKTLNGRFTVYGEHISYRMSDFPVETSTSTPHHAQRAAELLADQIIGDNPFEIIASSDMVGDFGIPLPKTLRAYLLGDEGSMLQTYGGEWKFDNYKARLYAERGTDNGVAVEYGKNITGITYDDDITDVYNGIYPFWKGKVDDEDTVVELTTNPIIYSANHASFAYDKIKVVDLSSDFKEMPTETELRERATEYITENGIGEPKISINVNFIPLWQAEGMETLKELEKVSLCDTVRVLVPKFRITAHAKVVKTVFNVLKERYDSIEIGTIKQDFTEKVRKDIQTLKRGM